MWFLKYLIVLIEICIIDLIYIYIYIYIYGTWGGLVVKALHYWSGGPGIDFRWYH